MFQVISGLMGCLVILHVVISCLLTVKTLRIQKKAGVTYPQENRLFWVRRISGFALMFFILAHVFLFTGKEVDGVYLLKEITVARLIMQLLMVLSLLVHLISNIRPLRVALGWKDAKGLRWDVALVISVLLLLAAVAFGIYFVRWHVF